MRRIVTFTSVSLDGVMQAPGRADEDRRGGFEHGGWGTGYADSVTAGYAGQRMSRTGGLLLGRRTYEDLYSYWPKQKDNPFTDRLNKTQKFVVSNTLEEPLEWSNSTLLKGDAAESVRKLKGAPGGDLVILGSGQLVRSLMGEALIDEYTVLIHPLILGSGTRLFPSEGRMSELRLREFKPTTKGVVIATYQPESSPGSFPT
jgi:dihydrofolate reductase